MGTTNVVRKLSRLIGLSLFAMLLLLKEPAVTPILADDREVQVPPGFVVDQLTARLDGPTAFAMAPDGRIYITQKAGTVRVLQNNAIHAGNFIDISNEVNQSYNRGLVGITLHPNFPATPWVYLAYVYEPPEASGHKAGGARLSRVIRVSADPNDLNQALPDSTVILLGANGTFDQIGNPDQSDHEPFSCQDGAGNITPDCIPVEGTAHQANMLRFGSDGALYVGVGDGGEHGAAGFRAQNLQSLSGKILRINPVTGAGYTTNPFYDGNSNSNRSKIYTWGLRNPFRFTFHPTTRDLFIGDVGAAAWEEVNRGRIGSNFGWPCFEGDATNVTAPPCDALQNNPKRATFPVYVYAHADGRVAVVGGDFYTASLFPNKYRNAYFFGDYNTGEIWSMGLANGQPQVKEFARNLSGVVQITAAPDGHLYILTIRAGSLYRIRWAP